MLFVIEFWAKNILYISAFLIFAGGSADLEFSLNLYIVIKWRPLARHHFICTFFWTELTDTDKDIRLKVQVLMKTNYKSSSFSGKQNKELPVGFIANFNKFNKIQVAQRKLTWSQGHTFHCHTKVASHLRSCCTVKNLTQIQDHISNMDHPK